ncbi:MAG: NAD(P)H-binding protein [Bacteroidota bacterium]
MQQTAKPSVAILGCGWLGLPLLKTLVAEGYTVAGSSRSADTLRAIGQAGGQAYQIDLPHTLPPAFLAAADVLIITLPPRGRALGPEATANYLAQLSAVIEALPPGKDIAVIYTSSTGVYGAAQGIITETQPLTPNTHSSRAVAAAEDYLSTNNSNVTILRLAGLVAADRHPGRFFGGRDRPIPNADAPVNLVHRKDVIAAIILLLNDRVLLGDTYNVCAASHPAKGVYYEAAAQALGLAIGGKTVGGENGKIISSEKLRANGWRPNWDDLSLAALKKSFS